MGHQEKITVLFLLFALSFLLVGCHARTPLHDAAERGDVKAIERLVRQGYSVNVPDEYGATPVFYAADGETAQKLIDLGADVNYGSNNGRTPLHLPKTPGVVDVLVSHGADVNVCVSKFGTPLLDNVCSNRPEIVEELLKKGAKVDFGYHNEYTPMHLAAGMGHLEIAKILVKHGADVNAIYHSETNSQSVMYQAILWRQIEMIEYLKQQGAHSDAGDSMKLSDSADWLQGKID